MRLNDSHLTFGKIANEWARELAEAKVPGRRSRDEIFLEMVRGIWFGQFADMVLTIEMSPKSDKDGRRYKRAPMPITQEMLDAVVLVRQSARQRYPAASRREFLTLLKLEDYDVPKFLSVYLEPLTISKEDFGRWCDEHEHQRPQFWSHDRGQEPNPQPDEVRPTVIRRRGRRRRARDTAKRALDTLYPKGISNKPWKTLTAEVNDWLAENKELPVSEDTVRRAANRK